MVGNVVEDRAGWLTVRPSEPLECLRNRESRKALGEFLRTRIKEGRASLEAYAKYISSKRVDALDNWHIGSALLQLLPPGQGPSRWTGQREAIWLHGSLNPNQRTALKMGALNMRQLSPDQHRMVIRILTNTDSSRLAKDDKPYESEQKEQMNAAFAYDSILNDATEALPEGVLPSAPMSLELKQTPGLFGSLRSGGGEPQEFAQTGEAVALSWWSATHPGVTNDQTTFDWVVPQDCTIYSYVLRPKPGLRLTFTLKDYLNAGPRVKSMADLPEAFVKKVKSLVKLPPSLESSRN